MPELPAEIYIPAFTAMATVVGVLWSRNIRLTDELIDSTRSLQTIAQRLEVLGQDR